MTIDPKLFEGHTPAPWRVEEDDAIGGIQFSPIHAGDGPSWHNVAEVQGNSDANKLNAEDRANAQLISHAPEIEAERVRLVARVAELEGVARGGLSAVSVATQLAHAEFHGHDRTADRLDKEIQAWRSTARAALGPTP